MITIDDKDLPITCAEKLITAIRPCKTSSLARVKKVAIYGASEEEVMVDFYDADELEEIAAYLLAYVRRHRTELDA